MRKRQTDPNKKIGVAGPFATPWRCQEAIMYIAKHKSENQNDFFEKKHEAQVAIQKSFFREGKRSFFFILIYSRMSLHI